MTGPEGLIVFQGAESLQVRVALRAAEGPRKDGCTYTQALTRAKDTGCGWRDMEGTTEGQSHACTLMPQRSSLSVAISSGRMRVA